MMVGKWEELNYCNNVILYIIDKVINIKYKCLELLVVLF